MNGWWWWTHGLSLVRCIGPTIPIPIPASTKQPNNQAVQRRQLVFHSWILLDEMKQKASHHRKIGHAGTVCTKTEAKMRMQKENNPHHVKWLRAKCKASDWDWTELSEVFCIRIARERASDYIKCNQIGSNMKQRMNQPEYFNLYLAFFIFPLINLLKYAIHTYIHTSAA